MKKTLLIIAFIALICPLVLSLNFTAKADQIDDEIVTCDDLVESNGGTVSFKKIDPLFETYNINKCSDHIDTTNTIDEVLVLGTESSDTVFTFKMHVNRDYLTKYFNIIEWFVVPTKVQPYSENYGVEAADTDFEGFEITIKDVNNNDKYVIFRASNRPDSNTYCSLVSGRAGANGQSVEGVHTSSTDEINKSWATPLKASFVGCFSSNDGVPQGFDPSLPLGGFLSLDYETKQVFSVNGGNKGQRLMVKDLDDGRYMIGTDVPWDGFDSNELEVSLRFLNIVSGRTAQIAILGFNGMDFTKGKVIDSLAPSVIEDTVIDETLLYGEVGRAIPINQCHAYDLLDGYINDIEYKVYYNYKGESQREYAIVDGRFTPDRDGEFSIVARATDRYGNVGEYVRVVTVRKCISDLHLMLLDELKESAIVGERIMLPKAFVYGGSVNKKYSISVLYGSEEVDVSEDGYFTPLKQGTYVVRYVVQDYYEEPKYFDYSVNAEYSDVPIVYFPEIEKIVETGRKLFIPEFSAIDYSSFGDGIDANITYYIKEPSSTSYKEINSNYIPEVEGTYSLKITASSVLDSEKSVSKEYEIYAKDCNLIRDFFITNNMEIANEGGEMAFKTSGINSSFYFLNPVLTSSFELDFSAINGDEYVPQIVITLTDSINRDNNITLRIEKNNNFSSILHVSSNSSQINGAVSSSNHPFSLSLQNGWIYDGNTAIIKLSTYDNGKAFDGFLSGRVYVDFAVENSNSETTIYFLKFCGNQDFSYNADDITEPAIVYSDLGRVYKIGDEVSFDYKAFDLFDRDCTVSVRVEQGGKELSTGKEGKCSFVITEFGKYLIIFRASDKYGNETSLSFNLYCYDCINPAITVSGAISNTLSLGSSLSLPTATTSDNVDTGLSYSIYAKRPTGSFVIIDDYTFTPDVKGEWVIYYYTVDSCGNYALASFNVLVS